MSSLSHVSQLLNKATALSCSFYIIIRALSPGLDLFEPEGVFLCGIAFLAVFLTGLSLLCDNRWIIPENRFWLPLLAFGGVAVFSLYTAYASGNYQLAYDLGNMWLSDLFIMLAVSVSSADPNLRRLYMSCLLGGAVVACVYGWYQDFYGLDYFRHIYAASDTVFSTNENLAKGFNIRIGSDRVSGPYAYANSLAAVAAIALPLIWRAALESGSRKWLFYILNVLIVGGILLSGSKAGLASIILVQFASLYFLQKKEARSVVKWFSLSGWQLFFILAGAGAAFAIYRYAGFTVAVVVLSLLWSAAMVWGGGVISNSSAVKLRLVGIIFLVFAVLGFVGGVIYVGINSDKPKIVAAGKFVESQMGVRLNYWKAGLVMFGDHPFRGVGLDNFGEYYSEYKTIDGWEVRRAHNHYLQLAADGGVFLLLGFLAFIYVVIIPGRRQSVSALLPSSFALGEYVCYKIGLFSVILSFVLIYFLCMTGSFTGLGFEFFLSEFNGIAGSYTKAGLGNSALIINGFVHFIVLPAVLIITFILCWRSEIEKLDLWWLKAGIVAVLLQAFFDFTLYHAAVSGLFFVAIALSRQHKPVLVGVGRIFSRAGLILILVLGLVYFSKVLQPRLQASVSANIADKIMLKPQNYKDVRAALDSYDEALRVRPYDSNLIMRRAEALARLSSTEPSITPEVVLMEYDRARLYAPHSTGPLLGKVMLMNFFKRNHSSAEKDEIVQLLKKAVGLYPLKPQHHLQLALACEKAGDNENAQHEFALSLKLHEMSSDQRAKLSENELALIKRRLQEKR